MCVARNIASVSPTFKCADHYEAMLAFDTMARALQDGLLGMEYQCEPNKVQIGWREVSTGR